jgi:hypothetical protein
MDHGSRMLRVWMVVVVALVACNEPLVTGRDKPAPTQAAPREPAGPQPEAVAPTAPQPAVAAPAPKPKPTTQVFEARFPMKLALAGNTLAWTDSAGSLWTMPATGGRALELSNQQMEGRPMFGNMVVVGDQIVTVNGGDIVRVELPEGPLSPITSLGDDWIADFVTDGSAVYGTRLESEAIFRVALDGTHTTVANVKMASLWVRGDTLYISSYARGTISAVKTAGGKLRTIASGLKKPTGFVVDDKAAYVWTEGDKALRRIELATGKTTFLEKNGLDNTDTLAIDGDWIYATTIADGGRFVRVAKDGSGTQVLADKLTSPGDFVIAADAIFLAVPLQNQIIRFDKQAIKPL